MLRSTLLPHTQAKKNEMLRILPLIDCLLTISTFFKTLDYIRHKASVLIKKTLRGSCQNKILMMPQV